MASKTPQSFLLLHIVQIKERGSFPQNVNSFELYVQSYIFYNIYMLAPVTFISLKIHTLQSGIMLK